MPDYDDIEKREAALEAPPKVPEEEKASPQEIAKALKESGISFVPPGIFDQSEFDLPDDHIGRQQIPANPEPDCEQSIFESEQFSELIDFFKKVDKKATQEHKRIIAGIASAIVYQLDNFQKACERARFNPFEDR